ncbi:phosphopyruvate hydratase [Aureococcus anophagefferens]|nr:phosphopyruvate hydratase [Aureococcus anophagefferens]
MARFAALRDGGLSARRRRGVAVRTLEQQGVGSLLRLLAVGVAVAVACASAAYRLGGRLRAVAELETFFASDADAAAFATTAAACPRTYVYRLPPRLVDWAPPANPGTRVAPGVYVSADAVGENANLLEVVLDRLSRPESPCVATNPEDAELFLVPILPKSKHWRSATPARAGPAVCDAGERAENASRRTPRGAALAKRNATFCVEPPGLTPGRASIVTALLLGCVPVLFAPEQDRLWPLHWGPFREGSRVMLDAARARADPTYVEAALRAIPPADVAAMRRLVADRAVALQYGLDDVPGDALHVLLRGIRHAAGG